MLAKKLQEQELSTKDSFFLLIALIKSISFSPYKIFNWKVGCVLVKNNKILITTQNNKNTKEHAEELVIRNTNSKTLAGAKIYITLPPCTYRNNKKSTCTNLIYNSPIKEVVCLLENDLNKKVQNDGLNKIREVKNVKVSKSKLLKLIYLSLNIGVIIKYQYRKVFLVGRNRESGELL